MKNEERVTGLCVECCTVCCVDGFHVASHDVFSSNTAKSMYGVFAVATGEALERRVVRLHPAGW